MKVLIFDQQSDLTICPQSVEPIVKEVLSSENRRTDELSIYFVDREEISLIHQDFFADPSPTDCISFPMDGPEETGYHILGEVFICPKTAIDFILKPGEVTNQECYQEMTLYLVHGILHLLGYDDQEEKEEKEMRLAEQRHMENLILKRVLLHP